LGVFRRGEPGYPFQVLALPSSGSWLSTSIPHANGFNRRDSKLIFKSFPRAKYLEQKTSQFFKDSAKRDQKLKHVTPLGFI
jgi:hypothetical protein